MPTPGIFDVVGQLTGCSKVVQIIASTYAENVDTNSAVYSATGLEATITPTSEDNKVLVVVFQTGLRKLGNTYGGLRLIDNEGVTLAFIETQYGFTGTDVENCVGASGTAFLDSPASVDPLTYATEFNCSIASGSGVTSVQHSSSVSTMLLIEVLP